MFVLGSERFEAESLLDVGHEVRRPVAPRRLVPENMCIEAAVRRDQNAMGAYRVNEGKQLGVDLTRLWCVGDRALQLPVAVQRSLPQIRRSDQR